MQSEGNPPLPSDTGNSSMPADATIIPAPPVEPPPDDKPPLPPDQPPEDSQQVKICFYQ